MPRVLPSDILRMIDQMFDCASKPTVPNQIHTNPGHAGLSKAAAIVDLAERVPGNLLMASPAEYAEFLAGLAGLCSAMQAWQSKPSFTWDAAGYAKHPLHVIRPYLAHCPDDQPDPETAGLDFILDDALRERIRLDISSATRDFANGEWKGDTVLAGSATEALLLWAIQQRTPADIVAARSVLKKDPGPDMSWWHPSAFVPVAHKLAIIKEQTATQAGLAADFRNFIHPGKALRTKEQPSLGSAYAALAAVAFVVRDLTPS